MINKKIVIIFSLFLLLSPFLIVKAAGTKTGDSVYIAKDEIVSGNLYAVGKTITVDGTISGDLIAVAQTIIINGQVEGDIIVAASTININGNSGGNIRAAGSSIILNGSATRNINLFATSIIINNSSRIGWDALLFGDNIQIRGTIDGSLSGGAGQLFLAGKVGKNVNIKISDTYLNSNFIVAPETIINGDLNYTSKNIANISEQANIAGQTKITSSETKTNNIFTDYLWKILFKILSSFLAGLLLIFSLNKLTQKILSNPPEKINKTILPSLAVIFITPILAVLLALTIIGLPLALILFALWLTILYISKIFIAILIGQLIVKKTSGKELKNNFWPLLIGVIIIFLLFSIPYVGWILNLIAISFGLGKIISYVTCQSESL